MNLEYVIATCGAEPNMCGLLVDQPEAYENPMFVAALDSVTSGQLTTGQAAEKFAIRESALIAAVSWSDAAPASGALTASTGGALKVLSCQHSRVFTRATLASARISCRRVSVRLLQVGVVVTRRQIGGRRCGDTTPYVSWFPVY